ncbi:hypothetical protein [Crassaminicella profunda]|uniref:hypothetical protein n=1 Tax=Crassaminicella profunda TaxID=1286698 RepID=UPI001CA661A4|nr:hypothetical protein [Crassaminicella profunda]QZY55842.1 hypothetical protein K7H06_02155 [Crassaminicella profunda]
MCTYKEELLNNLRNKRSHQLHILQDLERNLQKLSADEIEIKELLLKVQKKEIESLHAINHEINNLTNS